MTNRFLTKQQVANRLAVTPRTVDNWCRSGFLPPPVKLGDSMQSRVRWTAEAVEGFEQRLCGKTAA
jgi:predicted DNA-binding transcriptional regulator AlpA